MSITSQAVSLVQAGGKTWPDDAKFYQPYEVDQILMNEFASCLSVKTFLNMADLKYQIELRTNAEFMSPTGVVPFMKVGSSLVAEFDSIVEHVNFKGYSLINHLELASKADLKTYINLVQTILETALLYIMWAHKETYNKITRKRNGFPHTWPLNMILPWRKRGEVLKHLHSLGWKEKSLDEVHNEVNECCKALSNKLGDKLYFIGDKPTELDAIVFGYLFTIVTTPMPTDVLADIVKEYKNLTEFCQRIHEDYFVQKK